MSKDMEKPLSSDSTMKIGSPEYLSAERLSALVDGDCLESQRRGDRFISSVAKDESLALRWARYQAIGDMLRSPELTPSSRDETFMIRMRLSLAAEPIVIAPQSHIELDERISSSAVGQKSANINEHNQGLKIGGGAVAGTRALPMRVVGMASGFAAAVALVAMSWSALTSTPNEAGAGSRSFELSQRANLPASSAVVVAKADTVGQASDDASLVAVQRANGTTVIRDARLDQYFAAHSGMRQGLGAGVGVVAPASFMRASAGLEAPAQQ